MESRVDSEWTLVLTNRFSMAADSDDSEVVLMIGNRILTCNSAVPLHVRAAVFRGTVLQSCLYGAELWGGSLQRVRPVQRVVSSGLRLLVGCGLDSKLPAMFAVYRELHCPPGCGDGAGGTVSSFLEVW